MNSETHQYNEGHAVIIPINPEIIMRDYPYMEITSSPNMESTPYPNMESDELSNKGGPTPPNSTGNGVGNNNKPSNYDNNSNGNGNINNAGSNPSKDDNLNNNGFSDYTESPFNPLTMAFNDTQTNYARDENEQLSLASNRFKLFVDETLKRVSEPFGASLKARLIIPSNTTEDNRSSRWGLKIFGARADLVQAAKKEIMRSPSIGFSDEEVDLETRLRTSKTIESLLFEEGDREQCETVKEAPIQEQPVEIDFPTMANLSGLLLGPKYHVIKYALAEYNCTISWDSTTLALLPTNSSLNLRVSGKDAKFVSAVIQLLKSRSDRIDELSSLAANTLVIDSGKLDWIFSSGAIKEVEEVLWKTGSTLTQLSDCVFQVTCLTGALLSSCLKRLHEILSRHQSAHFTFRFRNDFRDFSTKCGVIFDSLAQVTNCAVSQKCGNGCVEVEIGGTCNDLARALIRLDTLRSQIFETGSFDLKLVERRLRLHVPAEIREFICGKKDGKLNRIIKETGVNISLNMIGGDSMYVDLLVEDHQGVHFGSSVLLHALSMIEGELPSELTFHVPEVHHKRMIGHGGKVIQRIMKKWGVYVKFMNSQETAQCQLLSDPLGDDVGTCLGPLDNVVVKTPSKNGSALKSIKEEIFEECSVSEITGQFDIEAFKSLERIQSNSKSRVSISLANEHRPLLPVLLRLIRSSKSLESSLFLKSGADSIILEGMKKEINEMISILAKEMKNEISIEGTENEIILISPQMSTAPESLTCDQFSRSSLSSLSSDSSFKFFPSALFVVQSHPSLSASGSPILSSEIPSDFETESEFSDNVLFPSPVSSVAMNSLASLNSSPPLPVGHQKKFLQTSRSDDELNFALAETRRRSADIF